MKIGRKVKIGRKIDGWLVSNPVPSMGDKTLRTASAGRAGKRDCLFSAPEQRLNAMPL